MHSNELHFVKDKNKFSTGKSPNKQQLFHAFKAGPQKCDANNETADTN